MEQHKTEQKNFIFTALALIIAGAGVILVVNLYFQMDDPKPRFAAVEIGGYRIKAEIALSPEEHYRGLSGREALCAECGLLFVFPDSQERAFVMRGMNFPLDIIFINNGRITRILPDLSPAEPGVDELSLTEYRSGGPADRVLEVGAGFAARGGLAVGDSVIIDSYED